MMLGMVLCAPSITVLASDKTSDETTEAIANLEIDEEEKRLSKQALNQKFIDAIIYNNEEDALQYFKDGAEVNSKDVHEKTALYYAVLFSHENLLKKLLKKWNADPFILYSSPFQYDDGEDEGVNLVHIAAGTGHVHILSQLMNYST